MTSLISWGLLALVAPLVLLAPGYLVLRVLRAREATAGISDEPFETFAFSAALSLAIVVLLAFALSQTVGLSRATLVLAFALLLGGLGLLVRRQEADAEDRGMSKAREPERRSTRPEPTAPELGVPAGHLPLILIGVTLAIVATGALLYDGSEPYSQAYYANASEVEPRTTVEPGETVRWTIVVENHEQRPASYTVETVRIPQPNASEEDPPRVPADETELELEAGQNRTHTIELTAPDGGLWKVQTAVDVDGRDEPLTMHRWIAVSD